MPGAEGACPPQSCPQKSWLYPTEMLIASCVFWPLALPFCSCFSSRGMSELDSVRSTMFCTVPNQGPRRPFLEVLLDGASEAQRS